MTDKEFEKLFQKSDREIEREKTLSKLKVMNADSILEPDIIETLQYLQSQWNVKSFSHVVAILLALYDERTYRPIEKRYSQLEHSIN